MKRRHGLGATGDYPRGKLNAADEGGLNIGIATVAGALIINFGKPVKWIGLDKATALQLADKIKRRAEELP